MMTVPRIHETPEGRSLATVATKLVAVRQDMRDVELGLARLTNLASRIAGKSSSSSAARSRVGLP